MRGVPLPAVFVVCLVGSVSGAQAPTGAIAGRVTDASGAILAGAKVSIVNHATGQVRSVTSAGDGQYAASALLPGSYVVRGGADGFKQLERAAVVEAGTTTTVDLPLELGDVNDSVTVSGVAPLMLYESHGVSGVVTQRQIEDVPLNGRSFLELAKLEPGAQPPSHGSGNRTFVPVLGQPVGNSGRGTRVTIDGASVMTVGSGGSAMGFSQEAIQEFQISTVNFDLTTGLTDGASVNVVTRSGGNELHGAVFDFFRDHHLSAYPGLSRDPGNPDPFFQRHQFGVAAGGPLRRDRLFFFGNWERNDQRSVVETNVLSPAFSQFSRLTPTPFLGDQLTVRVDGRVSSAQTAFVRYSRDGNSGFGPTTATSNPRASYPSNWTRQRAEIDQGVVGVTSQITPTLVNDVRVSMFVMDARETAATAGDCEDCLGIGEPDITISKAGLEIGRSAAIYNPGRRYQVNESLNWQRGTHRVRTGVDWEHNRGDGVIAFDYSPALITLFSPLDARSANLLLPSAFHTIDDILQLPVQSVQVTVGDPHVPQEGGGTVRRWNTVRLYGEDTWRAGQRITVNYGLGWNIDRLENHDVSRPPLLAPLLGPEGVGLPRAQWKNLSPVLGMVWSPSADGRTVIRAGAGVFYDFLFASQMFDAERAVLGAPGVGSRSFDGSSIKCPVPDICGNGSLQFSTPSPFTGQQLLTMLPYISNQLMAGLRTANQSVASILLTKTTANTIFPADNRTSSAQHLNVGIQREIARGLVVSADVVRRHFIHLGVPGDANQWASTRGPVIPQCIDAESTDPDAMCSNGPIQVTKSIGRATYTGLLLRVDKRLSGGVQVRGSYAYSRNAGTSTGSGAGSGFNNDNWLRAYGPLPTDLTHIVNVAGVFELPGAVQLGLNFSYASAPPFSAYVGNVDFNGDGTVGDLLPGSTVRAFGRSMDYSDLVRLVNQFNEIYGCSCKSDNSAPKSVLIRPIQLPDHYSFGDDFQALDLRLSRSFVLHQRWRLSLIGEAFNIYNAANLSGYSGDLTSPATFGQPTGRATQIFGSGGPRAFQVGVRASF
jgi:hypothetical protein